LGRPSRSDLTEDTIERVFREESGRIVATLIRAIGDFDLAEEAMQEAFAVALERWPREGAPVNAAAWITTTARHKAIDRLRRDRTLLAKRHLLEADAALKSLAEGEENEEMTELRDDRLRLMFTCCHPALGREAQVALTLRTLYGALLESARTTAMLFMILIGALMFAEFINITTMPGDLKAFVSRFEVSPTLVVAAICAVYVVLGTAMEELSMVLLTIPVFFPVIVELGFDPVWFGILIVCVVEIGLISPPVGMNMFVLKTLLPEVPTGTVFRGVMPFMWADVVRLAILVAFPIISLWLPGMMK